MARQSISFTEPNEAWLRMQLETKEYTSKSDVVNDLIRQARARQHETEAIRAKLAKAEQSGFTSLTPAEILTKSKAELRKNGAL